MDKILIIKLGALGDVIRTTPLLRVLKGEITWVTQSNAIPLLHKNPFLYRVKDIAAAVAPLSKNSYRLVLSLDEDPRACRLAARVETGELIGSYEGPAGISYTNSSGEWFDMSLISRFGKKIADQKKWKNRRSYQDILFSMAGKKFNGEEYVLPPHPARLKSGRGDGTVGIEMRSGERWVGKRWPRFPEFVKLLKKESVPYIEFHQYRTLRQFVQEVDKTDIVATTDSLALHLALGLQKKTVALFTCTSPWEIYGYGRMTGIVSPLLLRYFYSTENSLQSGKAISVQTVFRALERFKPMEGGVRT